MRLQNRRFGLLGAQNSAAAYALARSILDRSITEYVDPGLTALGSNAFRNCSLLTTLRVHGVTRVGTGCIENTRLTVLALPSLNSATDSSYGTCTTMKTLDYGENASSIGSNGLPFPNLETLILRRSAGIVATSASAMNATPMRSGGAGCTVYIPKALYEHLGDGTALDYKANSLWGTYDGYGTVTWAQIEGSIYETQYADGSLIPGAQVAGI